MSDSLYFRYITSFNKYKLLQKKVNLSLLNLLLKGKLCDHKPLLRIYIIKSTNSKLTVVEIIHQGKIKFGKRINEGMQKTFSK